MMSRSRPLRIEILSLTSYSSVLMPPALLTAMLTDTQVSHFIPAFQYPRVLWSSEVLLRLGWVKVLDLSPSRCPRCLRTKASCCYSLPSLVIPTQTDHAALIGSLGVAVSNRFIFIEYPVLFRRWRQSYLVNLP